MNICLFEILLNDFPQEIVEKDAVILVRDENDTAEDIKHEDLTYLTTLGVRSLDEKSTLHSFHEWWGDNVGTEVKLQKIASEAKQLSRHRRRELEKLQEDGWTIKAHLVAFQQGQEEHYLAAKEIIAEAELKTTSWLTRWLRFLQ